MDRKRSGAGRIGSYDTKRIEKSLMQLCGVAVAGKIYSKVQWYNFFPYAPRFIITKITNLSYMRNKTK